MRVKLGHRFSIALKILGVALGIATIILGVNEATIDRLDRMGSNYWLAYGSTLSGIALIILILSKRSHENGTA